MDPKDYSTVRADGERPQRQSGVVSYSSISISSGAACRSASGSAWASRPIRAMYSLAGVQLCSLRLNPSRCVVGPSL
jgi:hypothetical protein